MNEEARTTLRQELLEFAKAVASADRAELIDVFEKLDERVERVLEATDSG